VCSIKALFPAYESLSVSPIPSIWSAAPLRFVVSEVSLPSDAFGLPFSGTHASLNASAVKTWAAIATQHHQTFFRRAESLSELLVQLRTDCLENWPQPKRIPIALMLSSADILERDLQCQARWSPDDIAAECCLEAASQLQVPVAQLSMDFEVHLSAQGHWVASYVACPQSLVQAYQFQLAALNFQLDVVTSSSQSEALCQSWGLQLQTIAEAFRPPHPGELAPHYFNLHKGSHLC